MNKANDDYTVGVYVDHVLGQLPHNLRRKVALQVLAEQTMNDNIDGFREVNPDLPEQDRYTVESARDAMLDNMHHDSEYLIDQYLIDEMEEACNAILDRKRTQMEERLKHGKKE